jgi:hypothetical protein
MEGLGAAYFIRFACSCLDLEAIVQVWTTASQQLPKARARVGDKEQCSPFLVLPDVLMLMRSKPVQFCFCACDNDVTESDCIEWQQAQENAGFRVDRHRNLNDSCNNAKAAAEEQRRRGEAQAYYGARCRPHVAHYAIDGWQTRHCGA